MNINGEEVRSYNDLAKKIKNWVAFDSEEVGNYDFIGMMILLRSVLVNLKKYSIDNDFESLDDFFNHDEINFIKKIVNILEINN